MTMSGPPRVNNGRRGSAINNLLNSMGIRQGSGATQGSGTVATTATAMSNGTQGAVGNATLPQRSNDIPNFGGDALQSQAVNFMSSDEEDAGLRDQDDLAVAASPNMMGTTPFDQMQLSTSGADGSGNLVDELPISLTLGANDGTGAITQPVSSLSNDAYQTLKAVRHFVYGSKAPENAVEMLSLELPRSSAPPESIDEEELRARKDKNGLFSLRLTPFLDHSQTTNPGLYFEPIVRTAGPCSQLVIGRYTERVRECISRVPEQYHPVVFKSKVVSRTHGCFKVDKEGNWYIRDVKSSSGTFLNHHRLSPASTMSKDTILSDGDVVQLGLDFRGGMEEIYRSVKMRVELNKSWKRRAMRFNKEALQRIKNLQKMTTGSEEEDCSICLSKIKPCQAIFISPCSHSWHYQCVRRLVTTTYPQFVCPNCRSSCDLEASLDSEFESDEEDDFDLVADDIKGIDMAHSDEQVL
ncbi:LAMI_0B02124g1_1 [Lachancea mirantina]|uniref:RING-type E3 ubiquitin transferase n=1 Tax=Lachancea mirantina TaxID=1230905 RepID=A0A1G4ITR4_9SACH|nr:LAMI_0B02124g1_1 [Lachancea mirantina]